MDVIPLEDEGFLFKFGDSSIKIWALKGGPWFIANRPLLLQKWKPDLTLEKLSLKKFPIWVVLCGVPLELLTAEWLSYIASAIGSPLCLDKATKQIRVHFSCVCVWRLIVETLCLILFWLILRVLAK